MGRGKNKQKAKGDDSQKPTRKPRHPGNDTKPAVLPLKAPIPHESHRRPALPRMDDLWSVVPITDNGRQDTLFEATKELWVSMLGFSFTSESVTFLHQDTIAKIVLNFNSSTFNKNNPSSIERNLRPRHNTGNHNLLRFLILFFERLKDHEACFTSSLASDAKTKAMFYAFVRMGLYNDLVTTGMKGYSPAVTYDVACSMASFDVPQLVQVVDALVDARRKWHSEEDQRALQSMTSGGNKPFLPSLLNEQPLSKKAFRSAERAKLKADNEFEKAGRALTALLVNSLTMEDTEPVAAEGEASTSAVQATLDDQAMEMDEDTPIAVPKPRSNPLPAALRKHLCNAVDAWIGHLNEVTRSTAGGESNPAFH